MSDPLGLIPGGLRPVEPVRPVVGAGRGESSGAGFAEVLKANLEHVNELQRDAQAAIEDLASGRRDDLETVLISVQKSDEAFRLLQALRNKMIEAYQEIQQMRV